MGEQLGGPEGGDARPAGVSRPSAADPPRDVRFDPTFGLSAEDTGSFAPLIVPEALDFDLWRPAAIDPAQVAPSLVGPDAVSSSWAPLDGPHGETTDQAGGSASGPSFAWQQADQAGTLASGPSDGGVTGQHAGPWLPAHAYPADAAGFGWRRPKTHLAAAVVVTVLFCWLVGGFAIAAAHRVDERWRAGDLMGARVASGRAGALVVVGAVVGVVWWAVVGVMVFVR